MVVPSRGILSGTDVGLVRRDPINGGWRDAPTYSHDNVASLRRTAPQFPPSDPSWSTVDLGSFRLFTEPEVPRVHKGSGVGRYRRGCVMERKVHWKVGNRTEALSLSLDLMSAWHTEENRGTQTRNVAQMQPSVYR